MAYSQQTIAKVNALAETRRLGVRLGLWAIHRGVSVAQLARAIGATRQTIYNWIHGGDVMRPYIERVERVIECLEQTTTAEEAWNRLRAEFNLSS